MSQREVIQANGQEGSTYAVTTGADVRVELSSTEGNLSSLEGKMQQ